MFPTAHGVVSQVGARQPSGGGGGGALGLVVADAEHATTTTAKGELEGLGYTVTVIEEGNVGTTDWSPFAALVACRVTASSGVGGAIRGVMNSGKPAVLGGVPSNPPTNNNVSTVVFYVRLTGSAWRVRSGGGGGATLNITDNTHPITTPFATGSLAVIQANGFRTGGVSSGTPLGISSVQTGGSEPGLIVWEAEDEDHEGTPLAARAVIVDFIGSGQALTADGLVLLDRSVRWAVGDL